MDVTEAKRRVEKAIREVSAELTDLSHSIHARPELGLKERYASQLLSDWLEEKGFAIERSAFGLETSFLARAGESEPRFVLCAEYDALPDIGHACGHNIIAAASAGAGYGASQVVEELGFGVDVLGTPAEESVGGKAILLERGAFEGVAAALMVHPAPVDILDAPYLAVGDLTITTIGKAAHASLGGGSGGQNALDALISVYLALKELPLGPYDRCNGVITDGGKAANVVPERAVATYFLRSRTTDELVRLIEKAKEAASEAAESAGCSVEFSTTGKLIDDVVANPTLADVYRRNAEALGRRFLPQDRLTPQMAASTDMGNVSKAVPSIHPTIGIGSYPFLPHQRGFAEAARSEEADKAIIDAATALAWTIVDVAADPETQKKIRSDFERTVTAASEAGTGAGGR